MLTYQMHPWHNQIAAEVDFIERTAQINHHKPKDEILLRSRLMAIEVSAQDFAELKYFYADYDAKSTLLYANYKAKCALLDADYDAKRTTWHTIHCLPNCPWDGKTIFTHRNASGEWCMADEGDATKPEA